MVRVAQVTSAASRTLDEDVPLLAAALAALGIESELAAWDDPGADWDTYALAVVRSTWGYAPRRAEFVSWAERVPRLANPAPVLRWNTDKAYLQRLPDAVTAGMYLVHVADRDIPAGHVPAKPPPFDGDVVVKPSVGAGSIDVARHASHGAAQTHVRRLQSSGRTAMVQPYLHAVDDRGETALVYFDGEYSHAIRKGPMLRPDIRIVGGLYAQEEIATCEPTAAERATADRIMARAARDLLYARVDLADGLLLEFEATEPSLFLAYEPGAAARLAGAIARRLSRV
jgi:glutathione synthase/RimK-type ligase-like ATP-grasp enzyme